MISLKQINKKIQESVRPFALFDDDPDGLSSFIQLKKEYPKLEGMPVKGKSTITAEFFLEKIHTYCPDLIIALDKPYISEEFRERAKIPIIWIDHHPVTDHRGTKYFNPNLTKKYTYAPPVSYWIHKMLKKHLWIAAVGTFGDYYYLKSKEFIEKYRHLLPEKLEIEEILFNSKFGTIIQCFDFILKGKTMEMKRSIKALEKIKEPEEILNRSTSEGKFLYQRYIEIKKHYDALLKHALSQKTENEPYVFIYPNQKYSLTNSLSTHLCYLLPNEFIIIARNQTADEIVKLSIRSKTIDLRPILKQALKGTNGTGGGHKNACGATIPSEYLGIFIENFQNAIGPQ